MKEITELWRGQVLYQCPECKTIKAFKNRVPECDCDEKTLESFFGKNAAEVLRKRVGKTFV